MSARLAANFTSASPSTARRCGQLPAESRSHRRGRNTNKVRTTAVPGGESGGTSGLRSPKRADSRCHSTRGPLGTTAPGRGAPGDIHRASSPRGTEQFAREELGSAAPLLAERGFLVWVTEAPPRDVRTRLRSQSGGFHMISSPDDTS
ncbi:Hypothetical protein SMAX5B_001064 [Scophthalmus maximus]|uniref:Uncharacterized protein n=1 Tax=Scophthalmus maximus TaxID=52904 RepID=A0A2U9CLC6_SCOMX|nr:Hypothetical protein SMAX5B_001064 [Scophthalmus maximus]AWP16850.1 Hypothetical protein SMAX5B_001064 [Scophthalmus maximus]